MILLFFFILVSFKYLIQEKNKMTNEKKSFFNERTEAGIRALSSKRAFTARGLVERISDLSPSEAVEIRVMITPGQFYRNTSNSAQASRKCYKHGDLIALTQPKTQGQAYGCSDIPLQIRDRDFSALEGMREDEINFVGYSFRPVQGNDKRKRVVPFVWIPEALRLFAYSETMTEPIKITPYADAARVKFEGADVICNVPSREKGKARYNIKLKHVPVEGSTERRAVAWSLSNDSGNKGPEHSLYNIKYNYEDDIEGSEVFTFYPHDIAAYVAVIKHFNEKHNLTPIEMSPLALPSKRTADFYTKLCNNVLIYDPSSGEKDHLRKLHIDEKSILLARSIGVYGHDETMFWNPERDGMFKDYKWQVE